MRTLILIHGRSQQGKDPRELKDAWMAALRTGLDRAGLDLDIPDDRVRLPFYGDTLDRLVAGDPNAPEVIAMGGGDIELSAEERRFIAAAVQDAVEEHGITDAQIREEHGDEVIELGPQNWPWVLAAIRVLEKVPGLSGPVLAAATRDVFHYLRRPGIRTAIDTGVRSHLEGRGECVVVGHSLGSVVAYQVLRARGSDASWSAPSLITLGSPLAVRPIIDALTPISRPAGLTQWFNAYDPRDVVSLHPLDQRFPVRPPVENHTVDNHTPNRHGIEGYLSDPEVARRIHDALIR